MKRKILAYIILSLAIAGCRHETSIDDIVGEYMWKCTNDRAKIVINNDFTLTTYQLKEWDYSKPYESNSAIVWDEGFKEKFILKDDKIIIESTSKDWPNDTLYLG